MECMFTAQGPSVLHTIEVAVVQFAQVHLVYIYISSVTPCVPRGLILVRGGGGGCIRLFKCIGRPSSHTKQEAKVIVV